MKKLIESKEAEIRFRNFNWEKARSFYIVAKMGTISKAAEFFRISQSAISRQIIDLEQALGTTLFIREPRGVRLTRKGEELYSIIETTFSNLTGFTRSTYAKLNGTKRRKIRICTTHAIASYILDDHIFNYNEQNPHLVFELISDDHTIDIILNDVDIVIRPFDIEARGVQQEPLLTLEKKLYASQSYLDKYGEPKKVEDLRKHRILSFARADELPYADINWILRLGMPQGELNQSVYTSSSIESVVKAAQRGLGIIASYHEMKIIRDSKLKNILPKVIDKTIEWYITIPNSLENDDEIISFKSYIKEKLKSSN